MQSPISVYSIRFAAAMIYAPPTAFWTRTLVVAIVYAVVIFVGGFVIRLLTRSLLDESSRPQGESARELRHAGMYIGWLERFVILTAMLLHSPATAGLVLTAKAIARYPEFKQVRFAEYFLIGTLLSISAALVGGAILFKLLYGAVNVGTW
ncbi:MAG TPA: hypothetical protein VGR93_09060 [Candidatus Acidoferrales bacterium]|nr:hypothetical protein [Candidatus Acidoferrales bacterium]